MSLRDYDRLTPRERREKADGKPIEITTEQINEALKVRDRVILGGCECRMCLAARSAQERRPGELTRKCPEAPPVTREDEKDTCQDNSVDGSVSWEDVVIADVAYRLRKAE